MQGKITIAAVRSLKPGQTLHDSEMKGFQVRRRAGDAITYSVRHRYKGRNLTITIGKHDPFTPHTARKEAARLLTALAAGIDPRKTEAASLTLATTAVQFLEHIQAKRAENTHREYKGHLHDHLIPKFGRRALDDISTADLAKLHLAMKARPFLANRVMATLSSLYTWAYHNGHVPYLFNPTRLVERYPEPESQRFVRDSELKILARVMIEIEAEGKWSIFALAAIRLLLFTGCRLSEIRKALWTNVNWERCTLYVKGKRGFRHVHLNPMAIAILESLQTDLPDNENPYIIRGTKPGQPYANLQDPWQHVRERAGLTDVRLHDLRHTLASLAGAQGASLPIIAGLLGNTPAAARRYTHVAGDPAKLASHRVSEKLADLLK